jgi:hypothetical protein
VLANAWFNLLESKASMQVLSERTILKAGNITLTDQHVTIGAKSYAISNIASVRIQDNEPRFFLPVFFMLITGIGFALVAASDMEHLSHFLTWGLYLSTAAFFCRKPRNTACEFD